MLSKLKITQYCIRLYWLSPLTWLDPWHLWLLCVILRGSLHSTIFPSKSLLCFGVKHWQNEMFNNLCGKFRGDLTDWNFISCIRRTMSCRECGTNWLPRRWNYWKSHDIIIFVLWLCAIHFQGTLLPWVITRSGHNEVIELDLALLIDIFTHPRKRSTVVVGFRRHWL